MGDRTFRLWTEKRELSPDQRDVIETAIANGDYVETGRTSPELDELLTLLREEEPRRDSLIKYEGDIIGGTNGIRIEAEQSQL